MLSDASVSINSLSIDRLGKLSFDDVHAIKFHTRIMCQSSPQCRHTFTTACTNVVPLLVTPHPLRPIHCMCVCVCVCVCVCG